MSAMATDSLGSRAKRAIQVLFSDRRMWTTVYPEKTTSFKEMLIRPSSSSTVHGKSKYVMEYGVPECYQMSLETVYHTFLTSFEKHAHSETFWDNIMLQIRSSFASSMVSYRINPKERNIIDGVVMPMVKLLISSI